jgi:hypothetical protein
MDIIIINEAILLSLALRLLRRLKKPFYNDDNRFPVAN